MLCTYTFLAATSPMIFIGLLMFATARGWYRAIHPKMTKDQNPGQYCRAEIEAAHGPTG